MRSEATADLAHVRRTATTTFAVNVRCLNDVVVAALTMVPFDERLAGDRDIVA